MLRWEASDDFEILLTGRLPEGDRGAEGGHGDRDRPGRRVRLVGAYSLSGVRQYPTYDERFLPPNPFITYATYSDPRSGLTFKPETEYESWSTSARADWGITDGVDMALILAYADITSTLVSDADGSPINVQSTSGVQTIDYYTAELRFSGRALDRRGLDGRRLLLRRRVRQQPDRQHPVPELRPRRPPFRSTIRASRSSIPTTCTRTTTNRSLRTRCGTSRTSWR